MYVCYQNTGLNTLLKRISVRACLGHNMAVQTFVDSFVVAAGDSEGTTYARSGYGFSPKACIVWSSSRTESTDTTDGTLSLRYSIGFGSSTTRMGSVIWRANDNVTTTFTRMHIDDDKVAGFPLNQQTRLAINSLDSDGITFIVSAVGTAGRVFVWAVGGDSITNAEAGIFTTPTATGNWTLNNVDNFQPDIAFFLLAGTNSVDTSVNNSLQGFGYAISTTKRGRVTLLQQSAVSTSNNERNSVTSECIARGADASPTHRNDFVSFNSSPGGVTLNQLESTTAQKGVYLMIKGGDWNAGTVQTRTDTNDIAVTGLASQPSGIFFFGHGKSLSLLADTGEDHAMLSVGAASSPSNRGCLGYSDENGLTTTEITTGVEFDEVYMSFDLADGIEALMDLKSIESTGFTCVMDDVETLLAADVHWISVGPAAAGQPTVKRFGGVPYMAINRGVW